MLIKLNYPYGCRHCNIPYVILPGKYWNSFIPVEIIDGTEKFAKEFDPKKHKSHLLNCSKLQAQ